MTDVKNSLSPLPECFTARDYVFTTPVDENGVRIRKRLGDFNARKKEIDDFIRKTFGTEAASPLYYVPHAVKMIITWDESRLPAKDVAGKRLFEIGPGKFNILSLFYAQHGAEMHCLEEHEYGLDETYIRKFYACMLFALPDLTILRDIIVSGKDIQEFITFNRGSVEAPETFASSGRASRYDYVISNTVLEHVSSLRDTLKTLRFITKPGGLNIHKVDFRAHLSDDGKPLEQFFWDEEAKNEHLLKKGYEKLKNSYCLWRNSDLIRAFHEEGFTDVAVRYPEIIKDKAYFTNFLRRLRDSGSEYGTRSDDDLSVLGAVYFAR